MPTNMKKKDLLNKWLNGELTPEEFEVFRTIPEFSSYLKIDAFVKDIDLPKVDVEAGLAELQQTRIRSLDKEKPKLFTLSNVMRVAAILILLLASYYFIANYSVATNTDLAQTEVVHLPDNSLVTVNENSELRYKKFNWGNDREVTLDGEAYFEVEKGSTFTVNTKLGSVRVLGTRFNVSIHGNDLVVSCYEGEVRVMMNDLTIDLPAGRIVSFNLKVPEIADVYLKEPKWLYNESTFNDVPIMKVLSVLESEYNLDLSTKNIDVNLRFTGGFPNDDLEAALQAVTIPLKLNYSIENKDDVTIFGKTNSD
ncbi:anti-sigma factor [Pukyongia salina]|uniref:Anti-sigma factor n=2 Tax=Pukyongia salina TaxID=2094025 RepID=A0A2S0HTS8_9FLAO|nr:anti-sigma factor [Pukyongia salina]